MLLPEILNAIGLALDIFGFLILFALALPTVMRRHFVASERVCLDGVSVDSGYAERLMNPQRARLLERRRRQRQTCYCWAGGLLVLLGFAMRHMLCLPNLGAFS